MVVCALPVIGAYKKGLLPSRTASWENMETRAQGKCHCIGLYDFLECLPEEKRHHRIQRTLESKGCVKWCRGCANKWLLCYNSASGQNCHWPQCTAAQQSEWFSQEGQISADKFLFIDRCAARVSTVSDLFLTFHVSPHKPPPPSNVFILLEVEEGIKFK